MQRRFSKIVTGLVKVNETMRCVWDGEEVDGKVAELSKSRSEVDALLENLDLSSSQTSPDSNPSPPPAPMNKAHPKSTATGNKPTARTLASGCSTPWNLPEYEPPTSARILYNLDEDVAGIVSNSAAKFISQETQTTINKNSCQTDPLADQTTDAMDRVMRRIDQLESKIDRLLNLSSTHMQPLPDSFASDSPCETPGNLTLPTERIPMTGIGFWYLTPSDILSRDSTSIVEAARKCLPLNSVNLDNIDIDSIKSTSLNQRNLFAKNLYNVVFQLYNGRVSHGASKENLNTYKIGFVRENVFKYFPCLPIDERKSWSDCVQTIDKSTVYVFSVLNKKFDLQPIIQFLN